MPYKTIHEVLQDAVRLEQNSYDFYQRAKKALAGKSDMGEQLLEQLAQEELSHKNTLSGFTANDLEKAFVQFEPEPPDLDAHIRIPLKPNVTHDEIQKAALQMEEYTRDYYDHYAANSQGENLRDFFNSLAEFERQHIHKIKFEFGDYYGI